jgi:hypothetical protein
MNKTSKIQKYCAKQSILEPQTFVFHTSRNSNLAAAAAAGSSIELTVTLLFIFTLPEPNYGCNKATHPGSSLTSGQSTEENKTILPFKNPFQLEAWHCPNVTF